MTIIETSSRKNFFSWILYCAGTLSFIVSLNLFIIIIESGIKLTTFFIPIIPLIIGILSLRMLLWFIRGKEIISVINDSLIISKNGTFWISKEKRFSLNEIKKIIINKNFYEMNSPSELVGIFSRMTYIFKIQNTGRIKIILEHNSYRFLDNIEIDDAQKIIERIKQLATLNKQKC